MLVAHWDFVYLLCMVDRADTPCQMRHMNTDVLCVSFIGINCCVPERDQIDRKKDGKKEQKKAYAFEFLEKCHQKSKFLCFVCVFCIHQNCTFSVVGFVLTPGI